MKKIVCILLFGMVIFVACGCVSRSEYKALESRVEVLEQRNGISSATKSSDSASGQDSSGSTKKTFSDVITNSDEVTSILAQEFGNDYVFKDNGPLDYLEGQFYQFGNGEYFVYANDVLITVYCEDFVAMRVQFSNGIKLISIDTPSGSKSK